MITAKLFASTVIDRTPSYLKWTLFSLGLIFMHGSFLYVAGPTFSGTNLISAILIPIAALYVGTQKISIEALCITLAFLLLLGLSVFALANNFTQENFRLLRNSICVSAAVFGTIMLFRTSQAIAEKILIFAIFSTLLIAILQNLYLVTGVGLDPYTRGGDDAASTLNGYAVGVPSVFGNPNDFSSFACAIYLYFFQRKGWVAKIVVIACLAAVFVSGSRLVMVIILLSLLFIGRHSILMLLPMFVSAAYFLLDFVPNYQAIGVYSIDRAVISLQYLYRGDASLDGSFDVRSASHLYFFSNYLTFLSGSFDASDPFPQFNLATFDTTLIAINPHSLMIELHALFGILGAIIVTLLGIPILTTIVRNRSWIAYSLFLFASLFCLTSISASVLAAAPLWAAMTAVVIDKSRV